MGTLTAIEESVAKNCCAAMEMMKKNKMKLIVANAFGTQTSKQKKKIMCGEEYPSLLYPIKHPADDIRLQIEGKIDQ